MSAPHSHNLPPAEVERTAAIGQLHELFDQVTTRPLEETLPGFQDRDTRGRLAQFAARASHVNPQTMDWKERPDVTFRVERYPGTNRDSVRDDVTLVPGHTRGDELIEELTGKEVVGSVVDYLPDALNDNRSSPAARYIFVRDETDGLDVLELPHNTLASTSAEQEILRTALWKRNDTPWLTPDLLRRVFGQKIQPASTEAIAAVTAKLERHIAEYPEQEARYQEKSRATAEAFAARKKTLGYKLGRLLGFHIG